MIVLTSVCAVEERRRRRKEGRKKRGKTGKGKERRGSGRREKEQGEEGDVIVATLFLQADLAAGARVCI